MKMSVAFVFVKVCICMNKESEYGKCKKVNWEEWCGFYQLMWLAFSSSSKFFLQKLRQDKARQESNFSKQASKEIVRFVAEEKIKNIKKPMTRSASAGKRTDASHNARPICFAVSGKMVNVRTPPR